MEGLGRVFNIVLTAADNGVGFNGAQAITFVCNTADTFTLTTAITFGGTYRAYDYFTPEWLPITHYYQTTAANGTAAWTRETSGVQDHAGAAIPGDRIVQAGANLSVFTLNANALPSGYKYVKLTSTGGGTVVAIQHDLLVQRKPANLEIVAA